MAARSSKTNVTITKAWLQKCVREGLTQEQMVVRFMDEFGEVRTRAAIAVAMSRNGVKPAGIKHPITSGLLPWKDVKRKHHNRYEARMLRALAHVSAGRAITPAESKRLVSWLAALDRGTPIRVGNEIKMVKAVVHYDPTTEPGFFLVPREIADGSGYVHVRGIPSDH